jgi:predicted O-methyltransferase YrrM
MTDSTTTSSSRITLADAEVQRTLDRLHADADTNDPAVLANVWAVAAERGAESDEEMADLLVGAFMPIDATTGQLLHLLARCRRPGRIVEFGCSMGLSAIYLATALESGDEPVVTTELEPTKVWAATTNIATAGLTDRVEIREGDARSTLADFTDPISLLFLDGWKGLYLPMLHLLEPLLVDGALVIADDVTLLPELCAGYLDYVGESSNGYFTAEFRLDDGLAVSRRERR